MAAKAKRGSRNGIEWRTDTKGVTRYRGVLNTKTTGKANGPWCKSNAEAKAWRVKAQGEVASGVRRAGPSMTLRESWAQFIAGAQAGTIHDRTGKPYKPSTLRGYERAWKRIDPEIGAHRLDAIRRADLQGPCRSLGGGRRPGRHDPKQPRSAADALPARRSTRPRRGQPNDESRHSARLEYARADSPARGSRSFARGPFRRRARSLGERVL